jgi:hypothetical protein
LKRQPMVISLYLCQQNALSCCCSSGLYHKRQTLLAEDLAVTRDSSGKTTAQGTNVTPNEEINTCYSSVFYYLLKFLGSPVS